MPLLLKENPPYYVLAIDLPGHGLSSHLPPGRPIYFMDLVSSVYRVIKWILQQREDKFLLYLGHSFGGQLGLYVGAIFPNVIGKLVLLDVPGPPTIPIENFFNHFRTAHSKLESLEARINDSSPPLYSIEEGIEKIKSRFHGYLTDKAAKILLARSTESVGENIKFTLDQRLKFGLYPPFTKEQQYAVFSKITCPMQLIIAEDTVLLGKGFYAARMEVFRHCCAPCALYPVEGNHDVHLEHPERVFALIQQFLFRKKSVL